ncbi:MULTISPECIES: creatininase family protein [unclassified Brevibacterium]|uniref:creatininase family protein n=1 Tax=unclassified Brevibacterium TaxID=2614124 RepID=UPI0010800669|nr:creatininase family protein [Brevibacterium sp. S111]TGD12898.1 creatininase family protein [Brevibacterium sp. S111]
MTRQQVSEIRPDIRRYGELTSLEVEVAKEQGSLLILPVGACEQHGDALPLSTDSIRAEHVALAVAEELAARAAADDPAGRAFVLPSVDYGVSPHHTFLPGTISLDPRTFIDIVTTIAARLADSGFAKLLVITGHGGNQAALGVAQQVLLDSHPNLVFAHSPVSALATETTAALPRTEVSGHCGESETSQVLAIDDRLVDSPRLAPGATRLDELDDRARLSRTKTPASAVTFDRYADNGVLGDPRTATAKAGRDLLGEVIAKLVAYSRDMLRL